MREATPAQLLGDCRTTDSPPSQWPRPPGFVVVLVLVVARLDVEKLAGPCNYVGAQRPDPSLGAHQHGERNECRDEVEDHHGAQLRGVVLVDGR